MAHTAPPSPIRRPAERLLGFLLLVLGLALAVIAYTALGHPHGRHAGVPRPLASAPAVAPGTAAAADRRVGSQKAGEVAAGYGKAGYATTGQAATGQATTGQATTGERRALGAHSATPLVVLDNTGRPAVARNATERFQQAGWIVTGTGIFSGDILSTAAYYDPASDGAQAAAEALQAQFPAIQRVRPRFDGLPRGPVVVVLAYDYSREQTTS